MKFYYATVRQNKDETFCAFVASIEENNNLKAIFERLKDCIIIQPCKTKKQAIELTDYWNNCYKINGTYSLM